MEELLIDIVVFVIGYFAGFCIMALLAYTGKENAIYDAYDLGYEIGMQAEKEKGGE